MRNSAFPANSARIQTRALSVRPLAAAALPSVQPLNPSTLQRFPVSRLANHRARTTSHKSPRTSHPSIPTSHQSRVTSHASLLLLTSNSLRAITYVTVRICTFHRTLSLAPATLTRYPIPNSLPAITYEYRGGVGGRRLQTFCNRRLRPCRRVRPIVRNLLKTHDRPSELARFERVSASPRPLNLSTLQPFNGVFPS
jgi:hypothetical protein